MEPLELYILGCGSANPTQKHRPASQVLSTRGKHYMIDCGEGTQNRFARQGLSMKRVGHIFISHAHADHCLGLPGLICTMSLLGRTSQLHVHGPQELEPFLQSALQLFCPNLEFQVIFHVVDTTKHAIIHEDRSVEVWSLPLRHRVPCCGYLFREKPGLPHIRREMIDMYEIPVSQINNIKAGMDWTLPDGTLVPNSKLTTPAAQPRSYAYCSDTAWLPNLAPMVEQVDLLFHEATFDKENEFRAHQTFHSTTLEAAQIAKAARVGRLCIGHYSSRMRDEQQLLAEAQSVFPNTILANEGLKIIL
ncbi:MAG: ribonuclease Z [Bacteroidaceae bacterium]|nr:ribonuclease Z [Bacteroidaceae bacterium]